MDTNSFIELTKILLPTVIGGGVGYFMKYYLDKKKEIQSEIYIQKRAMYQDFIRIIVDLIAGTKNEDTESKTYKKKIENSVNQLYDFYKSYLIYSSPEFINAFGDFMQYTYSGESNTRTMLINLSRVIKSLRKEVGLSNRGLGKNGEKVFKAIFNDYEKINEK